MLEVTKVMWKKKVSKGYMSMSLGSVLKGLLFYRMESVKLMQYKSNLQYSVYLPYVSFWLASLCHLCWSPLPLPLLLLLMFK